MEGDAVLLNQYSVIAMKCQPLSEGEIRHGQAIHRMDHGGGGAAADKGFQTFRKAIIYTECENVAACFKCFDTNIIKMRLHVSR